MKTKALWFENIIYRNLIILGIFSLLGTTAYLNCLHNSFQYDDFLYVVYNKSIRSLSNIPQFFINPRLLTSDHHPGHYRPLVLVSYTIDYAFGGLSTTVYHLTNLIFHIGSSFLIFLIVKALLELSPTLTLPRQGGGEKGEFRWSAPHYLAALAAGIIFLVHPFNSEAVNYITARSSVMSGFFYLLGFWCWVKFRSKPMPVIASEAKQSEKGIASGILFPRNDNRKVFYIASFLAFLAGMLSKEVVITLPIVLWLYDLYFPNIPHSAFRIPHFLKWCTYLSYVPFILIVLIPYLIMRTLSLGGVFPPFIRNMKTQLVTELPVLVKHWRLFLIPTGLTPGHFIEFRKDLWSFEIVSSAIFLILFLILALYLCRAGLQKKWRVISFFMFWFFIVLLPTTIIPLNDIFQENRGYLAIVSFVVLAGITFGAALDTGPKKWVTAIMIFLIAAYLGGTIKRNTVWKDEISIWNDNVAKYPRSPSAYIGLGVAYRVAGMYNQSLDYLNKAMVLSGDNNFYVHQNIGMIYIAQEKWGLAEKEYKKVIQVHPENAEFHNDLGSIYLRMGRLEPAEMEYKEAMRLDHLHYLPHFNMGIIYTEKGMLKEAIKEYKASLAIFPDYMKSQFNLAELLEKTGEKEDAKEHYSYILKHGGAEDSELVQEARTRLAKLRKL